MAFHREPYRAKGDASHRLMGDTPPQNGSCVETGVPEWEPLANTAAALSRFLARNLPPNDDRKAAKVYDGLHV